MTVIAGKQWFWHRNEHKDGLKCAGSTGTSNVPNPELAIEMTGKPYRFNVGIALFNRTGQVFVGRAIADGPERVSRGKEWQMPQGGVDPNEDIIAAARRELQEETGIDKAMLLATTDEWWAYDFPVAAPTGHKLECFRGQQQRWAAFRFTGEDDEIDLTASGADFKPEFTAWRWVSLTEAVSGVVPYKRANYERMALAFARFASAG